MKLLAKENYLPLVVKKAAQAWRQLPMHRRIQVDLEDVIQDAVYFVHLRVLPNYNKKQSAFGTYLYTCLDNFFLSWRERICKQPICAEAEAGRFVATPSREHDVILADCFVKLLERASPSLQRFLRQYVEPRRIYPSESLLGELRILLNALSVGPKEFLQLRQEDGWKVYAFGDRQCSDIGAV